MIILNPPLSNDKQLIRTLKKAEVKPEDIITAAAYYDTYMTIVEPLYLAEQN